MKLGRYLLCLSLLLLVALGASAQVLFVGTNAPGQETNYTFTLSSGATNLSLFISNNASAYSYLLLKHGGTPTDSNFDFAGHLNGLTNNISLESPEYVPGTYGLLVSTPAASATQGFTVMLTTNRTDLRSATNPVSKPLVFSTTGNLTNSGAGSWNYFQVYFPSNLPSGWRVVLSSTNITTPGLYIKRGQLPTTGTYDQAVGPGQPIDTIIFTSAQATNSTYYIGVYQPSGVPSSASYTLSAELASIATLTWDPGTNDLGTQVFTNQSLSGGDYFFAITTEDTANLVWRTVLNVFSNQASLYLLQGSLPSVSSYNYDSTRIGSNGLVLAQGPQFSPGQNWYILVHATPGAQWNLLTGQAYVQPLPNLAADASSGATVTMGAEGIHFFETTITTNTLAWRLWLSGLTNQIYVKQTAAPVPYSTSTYDLTQPGQMLVVPTYLNVGDQYFVSVVGNPGLNFTLDSRQQAVTPMTFNSTSNLVVTGYGYTTYLVQVPVQQIAWQVSVSPITGNASVAVRQNNVPNEFVNNAFSEPPSGVGASVTLVPSTLSNGSFYLTVYSTGAYTVNLFNGQPVITTTNYVFTITNDEPSQVGWRYYTVVNTAQQLGSLGWELDLSNAPPGAEIAIRRNAVPGQWNYRSNPYDSYGYSTGPDDVDLSSTLGFLQQPNHPADVWYIGVYSPNTALGNFVLSGIQLTGPAVSFDGAGSTNTVTAQPAGKFQYFTITVPTNAFGWDLRINGATNGNPYLYVCRDLLPTETSPPNPNYYYWYEEPTWPSTYQVQAGYDWTGDYYDNNGIYRYGQVLQMGMGNPLQPGTYYVGVESSTGTTPFSYSLVSRGIGTNFTIPIISLPFTNGVITTNLLAREAAYYEIVVPTNLPSWQLELSTNSGEALLMLQENALPNVDAGGAAPYDLDGGRKMEKPGSEQYLMMPPSGQSNIVAGTYYLAVASQGMGESSPYLGTGSSSYTLTSIGTLGVTNIGVVGLTDILVTNSNVAGQLSAFQFAVPSGTLGIQVSLENVVGDPVLTLRADSQLPGGYDSYGVDGGQGYTWSAPPLINISNPTVTNYTLMVQAVASGGNASYRIRIHAIEPQPITFDGGSNNIVNQVAGVWQYFVVNVPTNAFGWDLRINGATNANPYLYVCRDLAPTVSSPYNPNYYYWFEEPTWPSTYQIQAGYDWTGDYYENNGTYRYGQVLEMGMGNALQPGTYYVGVMSSTGTSPFSYTLLSRGIGTNFTIPIISLPFTNGVITTNLLAREAAYYEIVVPTNLPSWQLELSTNSGEALLMLQENALPNVEAAGSPPYDLDGGRKMEKSGSEQYLMMPPSGQSNIVAGTYYLAVVSQGVGESSPYLGTNSSSYTLTSFGTLGVTNIGVVGLTDILVTNSSQAGQLSAFQFSVPPLTLSMQVSLENVVGDPVLTLRADSQLPGGYDSYGVDGGQAYTWSAPPLINISNPTVTNYTLMVQAVASGGNASYRIRIHAIGPQPVTFDGGSFSITNQPTGVWQYFVINVPANAFGWDLRINGATNANPYLYVSRDVAPTVSSPYNPNYYYWFEESTWPSTYQVQAGYDWTSDYYDNNGTYRYGQVLQMGMGNALQAGTYYVGVMSSSGTTPFSYTLLSRGIGTNFTLPIVSLPFTNGITTNLTLNGREAAYYSVVVPTNVPSWKLRLSNISGETLLMAQENALPNVEAGNSPPFDLDGGRKMQKAGNEQYVLLPIAGQSNIVAGTYYLAVASEGMNPSSPYLGTNSSAYVLTSFGVQTVSNLGPTSATDILVTNSLQGGENAFYQFSIPPGTLAVEARLDNVTGGPFMTLSTGTNVTVPYYNYGYDGGVGYSWDSSTIITLPNPTATNYSLTVQASYLSGQIPDAVYTAHIREMPTPALVFDPTLNSGGASNVVTGTLLDGQSAYYEVTVPSTLNGQPVIGWVLSIAETTGTPSVRVRQGALPDNYNYYDGTSPFQTSQYIVVPPYLTPGIWYVEVKGSGITSYTLTSSSLQLNRPAWIMPAVGAPVTTTGLPPAGPLFADTGVDTNGMPLMGLEADQGVDLAQGQFNYYAIIVPTNNTGILRTRLDALSGNPNLYIRAGAASTLSHYQYGNYGATLYDRSLSASSGSEYGNWVPLNGRFEAALTNGIWYLAVQAGGGSNVRYRLRMDTGNITNLVLNGGSATNQQMVAGDWLYYAFQIPTNAPVNWNVNFTVQLGSVVMYVRDRVPPGQATTVTDYRDWNYDDKNQGPYLSYSSPGTYTLPCPPLRPGNTYYLGFRAVNDSTFSLSSGTNGFNIDYTNVIAFYHGYTSNTIPAFGLMKYRVDVPGNAVRWNSYSTNASSVWLYLEQGSAPTLTTADDWYSIGYVNSAFSQYLQTPDYWPWQPGYSYFLAATNTSASPQPFIFVLNGEGPASGSFGFGNVSHLANGNIQLTMTLVPGLSYELQSSTNFINWNVLDYFTPAVTITNVQDINPIGVPYQFFRIQEQ